MSLRQSPQNFSRIHEHKGISWYKFCVAMYVTKYSQISVQYFYILSEYFFQFPVKAIYKKLIILPYLVNSDAGNNLHNVRNYWLFRILQPYHAHPRHISCASYVHVFLVQVVTVSVSHLIYVYYFKNYCDTIHYVTCIYLCLVSVYTYVKPLFHHNHTVRSI